MWAEPEAALDAQRAKILEEIASMLREHRELRLQG
jgi:hypothetical protein